MINYSINLEELKQSCFSVEDFKSVYSKTEQRFMNLMEERKDVAEYDIAEICYFLDNVKELTTACYEFEDPVRQLYLHLIHCNPMIVKDNQFWF